MAARATEAVQDVQTLGGLEAKLDELLEQSARTKVHEEYVQKQLEAITSAITAKFESLGSVAPGATQGNSPARKLVQRVPSSSDVEVQDFALTGAVPLNVKVSEVEAAMQAMSKSVTTIDSAELQLEELLHTQETACMNDSGQVWIGRAIADMEKLRDAARADLEDMKQRYKSKQEETIAAFVPALLSSVDEYKNAFEPYLNIPEEMSALASLPGLCQQFQQKNLKQPLNDEVRSSRPCLARGPSRLRKTKTPSDADACSPHALLQLITLAADFVDPLENVARGACSAVGGQYSEILMAPLERWARAMAKGQEDYSGDYLRCTDIVRCTIVFKEVTALVKALEWLTKDAKCGIAGEFTSFEVLRAKDRMSPNWDAETSGGNRDVLLNAMLELSDGRRHIVEVQLHLHSLFSLKENLHVIYEGLRVLGAADRSLTAHVGHITDTALKRAERGILRKLTCTFTTMTGEQRGVLQRLLRQHAPCDCPLLHLDLEGATVDAGPAFQGWNLGSLLGPPPVACRRLQVLALGGVGLQGCIPELIGECVQLQTLLLQNNGLTGSIPDAIGKCVCLRDVSLHDNELTGCIPDSLGNCSELQWLALENNNLTGSIPESFANLLQVEFLIQGNNIIGEPPQEAAAREREKVDVGRQLATQNHIVKRLRGYCYWTNHVFNCFTWSIIGFSTIGSPNMLRTSGVLYYELEILECRETNKYFQLGFATEKFLSEDGVPSHDGVGDDANSWALDGYRKMSWHDGSSSWDCDWTLGQVLSFAANIDAGKIAFAVEGDWYTRPSGVVFENDCIKSGVYPCFSGKKCKLRYNLNGDTHGPFKYGPPSQDVWSQDPSS